MSAFLQRGASGSLPVEGVAEDVLFVNERFENQTLEGVVFEQCTFANVSFKHARLVRCEFRACVFERCYFRRTEFAHCAFPATRFIASDFVKPSIRESEFRYTRFERCFPPYEELRPNLPGEDNLRAELSANLAVEAEAMGQAREARRYRLVSISARERHLLAALRGSTSWHRDHFDTFARVTAGAQLFVSWLNGVLWGHGERALKLIVNIALAMLVIWPVLYLAAGPHVRVGDSQADIPDALTLSVASLLNSPGVAGVTFDGWARWLVLTEMTLGFIALGLFVSYLLRWISRR